MDYTELRTLFHGFLNRDDCSDELADQFISMGLRRVERLLRTPLQKAIESFIIPEAFDGIVDVPRDYLGLIEVRLDGRPLKRLTSGQTDAMSGFKLGIDGFKLYGTFQPQSVIEIEYYAEFDKTPDPGGTTNYGLVLSDLVIFSGLIFAATYYTDARKAEFEQVAAALKAEIDEMSALDELAGGLVVTPYGGGIA
ncbi:hypothetical protein Q9295_10145 [Xinfangfangia sp. CPCC 101601]|uniref:Uncharacterized protein n=1 Tax=Pseudogemmobacter lacusdianii TaxID=3069608 RepID=A0ABU0VYC5_9RHOB|nr:hypothetical protein [Xinfangfangia sp. CPCC 101601]MDQ2066738.1 hypothetical protein [Xinfangfangia sp. CPCC 101601]